MTVMNKYGEKNSRKAFKSTVPPVAPLSPPYASASDAGEEVPVLNKGERKQNRFALISAGSIFAQDKGPHRFGGTSQAQSPAVRGFYGGPRAHRFWEKRKTSAPLSCENGDFTGFCGDYRRTDYTMDQKLSFADRPQLIKEVSPECLNSFVLARDQSLSAEEREQHVKKLLQMACDGDSNAQYYLGFLDRDYFSDKINKQKAELWFGSSARLGNHHAAYSYARCLELRGEMSEAIKWFGRAARLGSFYAQYRLAMLRCEKGRGR